MAVHRLQLLPDERVLVDIRPHWLFLSGPLAASLVTIGLGVALDVVYPHTTVFVHWIEGLVVVVPCIWLAARVTRWWTTSLVLTSFRLIEQWGTVTRQYSELPLADVGSVVVVQSLFRRMVATGRLGLVIRSEGEVHWIDDVRKPVILQRVINRRLAPWPGVQPGGG
ncbi:MAG: PH domain-containing protein [Acidimicrobiales bacterium]